MLDACPLGDRVCRPAPGDEKDALDRTQSGMRTLSITLRNARDPPGNGLLVRRNQATYLGGVAKRRAAESNWEEQAS
jgi:hypothetical protein